MRKDLVEQLGLTADMEVIQVKGGKIQPFSIEQHVQDADFNTVKDGVDHLIEQSAEGNREAWFAGIASQPLEKDKPPKPTQTYRIVFKDSVMSKKLSPA